MGRLKETHATLNLLAETAKRIFANYATRPHRTQAEIFPLRRRRGRPRLETPDARLPDIIAARLRHETLEQIAQRHGITRERVRQLIQRASLPPDLKAAITGTVKEVQAKPLRISYGGRGYRFSGLVNKWLAEIGCSYCARGRHVVNVLDLARTGMGQARTCLKCNNARVKQLRDTNPKILESIRRWQKTEKGMAYKRKWQQEHVIPRHLLTPEQLEDVRRAGRESWAKHYAAKKAKGASK